MVLPFIPEDSELIGDIEPLMAGEKEFLIAVYPGPQTVPVSLKE
jgi:hypothetical protein